MLLAAWESEQELMEKKEKEVSSLAKVGLVGRQAHQWVPHLHQVCWEGTCAPECFLALTPWEAP